MLGNIEQNELTVSTSVLNGIYIPPFKNIIAQHRLGIVYLVLDDKAVEMTTILAHKIGLAIAFMIPKLAPNELVKLTINRKPLELLPQVAQKVSTALLRKADQADDWQLENRR